jgi:hypothetical protein
VEIIKGVFLIILGGALVIGGVAAEITWLGICFGSVIIGVILLFVSPPVLFFPWALLGNAGIVLFVAGVGLILNDSENKN